MGARASLQSTDLASGEQVVVKLTRVSTDASDTLPVPARVEAIEFSYTAKR